jgi:hypothetical protein
MFSRFLSNKFTDWTSQLYSIVLVRHWGEEAETEPCTTRQPVLWSLGRRSRNCIRGVTDGYAWTAVEVIDAVHLPGPAVVTHMAWVGKEAVNFRQSW